MRRLKTHLGSNYNSNKLLIPPKNSRIPEEPKGWRFHIYNLLRLQLKNSALINFQFAISTNPHLK